MGIASPFNRPFTGSFLISTVHYQDYISHSWIVSNYEYSVSTFIISFMLLFTTGQNTMVSRNRLSLCLCTFSLSPVKILLVRREAWGRLGKSGILELTSEFTPGMRTIAF